MTYGSSDLSWISEMVLGLYSCATDKELNGFLLPAVHQHFRSGFSQVEEVSFDLSTYRCPLTIGERVLPEGFFAALADSPVVSRGMSTRWPRETVHLGQITSHGALTKTNFFNHVLREMELKDQLLAITHSSSETVWEFGVNRDIPFTDSERALFDQLRLHVEACMLRIRRSDPALKPMGVTEVTTDSALNPRYLAPNLIELFSHYFPGDRIALNAGRLPDRIRRWIQSSLSALGSDPTFPSLTFLRTEAARGHLVIRLFPWRSDGSFLLRLSEELRVPDPFAARAFGLTPRECEVLHWLMAGKRNSEIGVIVGCSTRTAGKHVENVLRKLGSHGRVDAARIASERIAGLSQL